MKDSEDVSRLFAMFGEKKTNNYREVYEDDQSRATLERWPVFKRVHVESDTGRDAAPSSAAPQAEQPHPFVSSSGTSVVAELRGAARESLADFRAHEPVAPAPVVSPKPFTVTVAPEPKAPLPAASDEGNGSLHSMFRRLQSPDTPAKPEPAPLLAAKPEQPAGSIRSLFNRLSRP